MYTGRKGTHPNAGPAMRTNLIFVRTNEPGWTGVTLSERVWQGEESVCPCVRGDTEADALVALGVALRAAGYPKGTSVRVTPGAVNFTQTGTRPVAR